MTRWISCILFALLGLNTGALAQSPAQNQQTLERVYNEIFGQGKLEVADQIFNPAFTDHNAPSPEMARGANSIKTIATIFRTAFPDLKLQPQDIVASDNKVSTRCVISGTMKGEFMGNAPTGKSFSVELIDMVHFDASGKILDRWGQLDMAGMMMQLGIKGF